MYYARDVDYTMITALNTVSEQKYKPTERTAKAITQLTDYSATHTNAVVRYKVSDMVLNMNNDASYLSESK